MVRIKALELFRAIAMKNIDATESWITESPNLAEDLAEISLSVNILAMEAGINIGKAIKARLEKSIGS